MKKAKAVVVRKSNRGEGRCGGKRKFDGGGGGVGRKVKQK